MAKRETMDKVEPVVDVVETVVENVQDGIETLERIPKLHLNGTTKKQQALIISTVAAGSLLVGVGLIRGFQAVRSRVSQRKKLKGATFNSTYVHNAPSDSADPVI